MLRPLEAVLEAIRGRDAQAQLFFCGDYCDRGGHTREVVDLLLSLKNASFVRGNHDDVMDLCCNGTSLGIGPAMGGEVDDETLVEVYALFRSEGLTQTLQSYGIDPDDFGQNRGAERLADWIRRQFSAVPARQKQFFRELPAIAESDDFFVCHATWPADQLDEPGRMNGIVAGDAYLRHDVLWGRYTPSQIKSKKVWRRIGYFGHTPTDNYLSQPDLISAPGGIVRGEKTVLLDTAAFAPTGRLTAICHETGEIIQVEGMAE